MLTLKQSFSFFSISQYIKAVLVVLVGGDDHALPQETWLLFTNLTFSSPSSSLGKRVSSAPSSFSSFRLWRTNLLWKYPKYSRKNLRYKSHLSDEWWLQTYVFFAVDSRLACNIIQGVRIGYNSKAVIIIFYTGKLTMLVWIQKKMYQAKLGIRCCV